MRILLIAGFSDSEIRDHLTFRKDIGLFKWLIRLFHLPARVGQFRDYGPWVKSMISYFEKRSDIELYVAVPHIRLKESIEEFKLRGVTYFFFFFFFSSFARLVKYYVIWKHLQKSGSFTKKIINRVNPNIVVLSGAENPVTSISILYAREYPRLCLCQTVYTDPDLFKYTAPDKLKEKVEQAIFCDLNYFGVYCRKHYELLNHYTKDKFIFKYNYPPKGTLPEIIAVDKRYDFVNFAATHSLAKGTHDSIKALAIVKRSHPNVTLNIVGGCDASLHAELSKLIKDLDLNNNVVFTPFFEKRKDLFYHIQKSRFAVLPCKVDNISGTMNQSMSRGIPIVVYKTIGTQAFNAEKECALIAEMGDIDSLAKHMITLLDNSDKADELRRNGLWYRKNQMDVSQLNWERMVNSFQLIIDHYNNSTPIPSDLLFDPIRDD